MNSKEILETLFKKIRSNSSHSLTEVLNEFNRGEIGVLSYLAFDKDKVTAGELSKQLNVTTARIASILNSLENKEYIKRKEYSLDKRKTLVLITNKGKKLANNAKREIINKIDKVVEEVGYDKLKEYMRIAQEIRNVLNKQE